MFDIYHCLIETIGKLFLKIGKFFIHCWTQCLYISIFTNWVSAICKHNGFNRSEQFGGSFNYSKNRKGPKIELCGTPQAIKSL